MLDEWIAEAGQALGLEPGVVDRQQILDLARDAAHGVARPAAPLTTYLVGVAVGRGLSPETAHAAIQELLKDRPAPAE